MFDSFKLIDLTHPLSAKIPTWNGEIGFALNTQGEDASISMKTSAGTHLDAPSMGLELGGVKTGKCIGEIPLNQLLAPCCVLDVSKKAHAHYRISPSDVEEFEKAYGSIPPHHFIIAYTGWSQHWSDPKAYRNADATGIPRFPTFSVEAIELLLEKKIVGVGTDALAPEPFDSSFPIHKLLFAQGKYLIENLANGSLLPPKGAYLIALPIKVSHSEAPARVIALI